jgi:CelD/BcsL family acetyltransferase involved in cellulose biosynthesis
MPRTRPERPITYRDRQSRVWYVSEIARLKVVSASIDGPNLCLVIRVEREGEERFARWIGGRGLARARRPPASQCNAPRTSIATEKTDRTKSPRPR